MKCQYQCQLYLNSTFKTVKGQPKCSAVTYYIWWLQNISCCTQSSIWAHFRLLTSPQESVCRQTVMFLSSGWHVSRHELSAGSEHVSQMSRGKAWPVFTAVCIAVLSLAHQKGCLCCNHSCSLIEFHYPQSVEQSILKSSKLVTQGDILSMLVWIRKANRGCHLSDVIQNRNAVFVL